MSTYQRPCIVHNPFILRRGKSFSNFASHLLEVFIAKFLIRWIPWRYKRQEVHRLFRRWCNRFLHSQSLLFSFAEAEIDLRVWHVILFRKIWANEPRNNLQWTCVHSLAATVVIPICMSCHWNWKSNINNLSGDDLSLLFLNRFCEKVRNCALVLSNMAQLSCCLHLIVNLTAEATWRI